MKIKLRLLLASLLAGSSLVAAPLAKPTAVHAKPDASSPTLTVLKAGTEPSPAVGIADPLPSGWNAVELTGPHEVYVQNKDITKSLEVRPGAEFRVSPKADAPVLSVMEKGDAAEISGLRGKWTQVKLQKRVVGYVNTGDAATGPVAATSAANTSSPNAVNNTPPPAPLAPSPVPPAASVGGPGRAVQMVNLGDGGSAALPRVFQGTFVSSRRPLAPRRPYDFQLNDSGGRRHAYLDLTRLLQTEQIDKYIDHTVVVYGTAKAVPNTKDMVIEVESLQLR